MRPTFAVSDAQWESYGSSGPVSNTSGQLPVTSTGLVALAPGDMDRGYPACLPGALYSVGQLAPLGLGPTAQFQRAYMGSMAGQYAPLMPQGLPSSSGQMRQEQGYRGLWQACNSLRAGESLAAGASGHGVPSTVEDCIAVLRSLPQGAPAVPAISAGLSYLDSRCV